MRSFFRYPKIDNKSVRKRETENTPGSTPGSDKFAARDDLCFCCGDDNPKGLKLLFTYTDSGDAETKMVIPEWFSGWKKMTHGGLLSMLLDECMAHACISRLGYAVTAELTVRYHKPVETGTEIVVSGRVQKKRSRIVETSGTIADLAGSLIASGSARFLLVDVTEQADLSC